MIKILDCTIRDGGHDTNWEFTDEYVINLLGKLNTSGISYCEIGYRNHFDKEGKGRFYNCTPEFLKDFHSQKGNLQLGIMTDTSRFCESDFEGASYDYLDFIRIASHPNEIRRALEIAEILKSRGYKIFVQLMDIPNIDMDGYIALYEWQNKDILESLYFADSYSKISPDEVEKYYNKLKSLGYGKISFHAHNNSGKALENTLKAIELGASSVDVSCDGLGGNLDSELLKINLNNSL